MRAQHFSTLYEAAFHLDSSVYPDLSSLVTQAGLPQSQPPTMWLYLPYGWHSVNKLASTFTLQPHTVTEVASLGAMLQPITSAMPEPSATTLPFILILSCTVKVWLFAIFKDDTPEVNANATTNLAIATKLFLRQILR